MSSRYDLPGPLETALWRMNFTVCYYNLLKAYTSENCLSKDDYFSERLIAVEREKEVAEDNYKHLFSLSLQSHGKVEKGVKSQGSYHNLEKVDERVEQRHGKVRRGV